MKLSNDYHILDKLSKDYDILDKLSNDYDILDKISYVNTVTHITLKNAHICRILTKLQHAHSIGQFWVGKTPLPDDFIFLEPCMVVAGVVG